MPQQKLSGQGTQEQITDVEGIIEKEFANRKYKGVSFYHGVYVGDFKRDCLVKLVHLLIDGSLNKETKQNARE